MTRILREHQVLAVVAMIGFASLGFDTWAAWHQFAQQQHQFHAAASFWGNGVSQNWQSEALLGIGLVLILQSCRLREREPDGRDGRPEGPSPREAISHGSIDIAGRSDEPSHRPVVDDFGPPEQGFRPAQRKENHRARSGGRTPLPSLQLPSGRYLWSVRFGPRSRLGRSSAR